jgi:hypothetical protein
MYIIAVPFKYVKIGTPQILIFTDHEIVQAEIFCKCPPKRKLLIANFFVNGG